MLQCGIFPHESQRVTNPRKPLRLNIGFLITSPIGVSRDFLFEQGHLEAGEDLGLDNFGGAAKISRTPQGLLAQGRFHGETSLECARCLKTYRQPLDWEFTELYAFDRRSMTESELLVPENGHIDLQPLVREYAILELPILPLCREDCKGLCPQCGQDLNKKDCGHRPENDSPFSILKDLLDKE
jgi:uncharacterized protein